MKRGRTRTRIENNPGGQSHSKEKEGVKVSVQIKRFLLLTMAVCCLFALCSCRPSADTDEPADEAGEHLSVRKAEQEAGLTDVPALYDYDSTQVVCFYVTVLGGNAADGTNHTLEEVNRYQNLQGMKNVQKIPTEVLVQIGDEEGPQRGEIGFFGRAGNASMNVRGRTSTGYAQKSYRLTLFNKAGLWRGQRAIALNKHPSDETRIRNMLYFELLRDVPSIPSLRTQFVHLYVKDLTAGPARDAFEDYGLYTQVELPNGRYLRNHGLSINGNLYKAQMCEMFRYPEALRLVTDPDYDEEAFREVLEPKTGSDHTKLLAMLDAVNDDSVSAEELLETYFDLDNLTSYLAFNMLMGNPDSNAQNYFLYSPVNSSKWYYLCWDGDDCLSETENEILEKEWDTGEWSWGVSNYWGIRLFNRLLRLPSFREALTRKMDALREIITPERVSETVARYRTVTDRFTQSMPDSLYMKADQQTRERIYENLPGDLERGYRHYLDSLEKPMPFHLSDAEVRDSELLLSWNDSYDFDGEFLRYRVQLARDWTFEDPVFEADGLLVTRASLPVPEAGEYYWRVTVKNESGREQTAFDNVVTASGSHTGMRRFTIGHDGTVVNAE